MTIRQAAGVVLAAVLAVAGFLVFCLLIVAILILAGAVPGD